MAAHDAGAGGCVSREDIGATFEEQLKDLIRIPSVSAQPDHDPDTQRAAAFVRDDLAGMGLKAELISTKRHPIVYAEWLGAPGKPTVLVYGHYDVQPAEPLEPWLSPPFEPTIRDGNLFARGATDDKGQMFTHLKAAEAWLKAAGSLPVNVKFLIEGEEEIGGANLEAYVAENHKRLACDYAVISDTSQFAPGMPAITYGLKGLAYFELLVQGANRDLHSGTYGGAVANPLNALAEILASLKGPDGKIRIDGFYDAVKPLEDWERAAVRQDAVLGGRVSGRPGRAGPDRRGRATPRSSGSGLVPRATSTASTAATPDRGPRRCCPCKAGAKLSFRLVPDQDPRTIEALFRRARPEAHAAGRDRRGDLAPRGAGRAGERRHARLPRRGPGRRGGLRRQAGLHPRGGLDSGGGPAQAAPQGGHAASGLGPERRQPPRPQREVLAGRLPPGNQGERPSLAGAGERIGLRRVSRRQTTRLRLSVPARHHRSVDPDTRMDWLA